MSTAPKDHNQPPRVSVIIPYKNEAATLPLALDSLYVQETDFPVEVLLADGCSTDGSKEVITGHPLSDKWHVRILDLAPEDSGMTPARNRAADQARGEILIFMQSDLRIRNPRAIEEVVNAFEDPSVAGTYFISLGPSTEDFRKYDFWGQVFMARYYRTRVHDAFDTKFNAIRRRVFHEVGGFDETRYNMGGEDFDFCSRVRLTGKMVEVPVEVEHVHGYGKTFLPGGLLKKYCRNSEVSGATIPVYWKYRRFVPNPPLFFLQRFGICLVVLASCIPMLWPWGLLLPFLLGQYWSKETYRYVRDRRLVLIPLFSFLVMYVFTFYFLKGLLLQRVSFTYDNRLE